MSTWRLRDQTLTFPPPLGAGIVNVTDDSFFEGARSGTPDQAVADGLALVQSGFDLLDVGAVAARSGPPVPAEDEAARLIPTVERLAAEAGVPVLADTFSSEVAERALAAGAAGINDIGGGADEAMLELVASAGAGYVLMQIEGRPREERQPRRYEDPVEHLKGWFAARIDAAMADGVAEQRSPLSEQGPVEVRVDAAQRHGRATLVADVDLAPARPHADLSAASRRRHRERHRRLVLLRRP